VCAKAASVAVRNGPGGGYGVAGYVLQGQCISVLGLSEDGNWFRVAQGWVWAAPHLWTNTGVPVSPPALVAQPASSAGSTGNIVIVESWVSNPAPAHGGEVVVYAGIAVNGVPRAGIPVDFAWQYPAGTLFCSAVTERDGIAACAAGGGGGGNVLIVGSFRAYGRNYVTTTSFTPGGQCDPAYPDFCLQPGLADLDCGDVPYRHFLVVAPDPHGFDDNGDSVGC
jgi:micrococcal nuclease